MSQQWKDLDEEGKQKYVDMAEKDKIRYEEEKAKYVPPDDDGDEEEEENVQGKKKKKKKDPNAPKCARNIYWFFCDEWRPKLTSANGGVGLSFKEYNTQLAKKYKEISASERERYKRMAEDDKKRHSTEMKLYSEGKPIPTKDQVDKEGNDTKEHHAEPNSSDDDVGLAEESEEIENATTNSEGKDSSKRKEEKENAVTNSKGGKDSSTQKEEKVVDKTPEKSKPSKHSSSKKKETSSSTKSSSKKKKRSRRRTTRKSKV